VEEMSENRSSENSSDVIYKGAIDKKIYTAEQNHPEGWETLISQNTHNSVGVALQ